MSVVGMTYVGVCYLGERSRSMYVCMYDVCMYVGR